jgi:flagellar biosynthetic protein FliR
VPVAHRAGLAVLLAFTVMPTLGPRGGAAERDALGWVVAVAGEVLIGVAIAFVAQLVLAAVEMAGELIGLEMGLSIAAVFDPASGQQETVIARFLNLFALLLFLGLNGHHLLIRAVAVSFQRIRPGGAIDLTMTGGVVSLGSKLLQSGCALAGPVVAILVVGNVALGLVARVAPQSNVFILGLPLSMGLGVLGLYGDLPSFAASLARLVAELPSDLNVVLVGGAHGLR